MITTVKVFISLMMQLSLAVLLSLTLVALRIRPSGREKREKKHTLAVSTALVDFHKSQCYFISALLVAALVLNSQAENAARQDLLPPFFDVLLSVPLSLNGLVPVVFTLCCVSRYGRMTWHTIVLSLISIGLSTATLARSYRWILRLSDAYGEDGISTNAAGANFQEGYPLAHAVCGSRSSDLDQFLQRKNIRFSLVWVIYSNCVAWMMWCVISHLSTDNVEHSHWNVIRKLCSEHIPESLDRSTRLILKGLGYCLYVSTWSFCFIYHFYLYSLFARYSLVSSAWTFGQIIAVTVWIPSIVELLYIEYGERMNPMSRECARCVLIANRGSRGSLEIQISSRLTSRQNSRSSISRPCQL